MATEQTPSFANTSRSYDLIRSGRLVVFPPRGCPPIKPVLKPTPPPEADRG